MIFRVAASLTALVLVACSDDPEPSAVPPQPKTIADLHQSIVGVLTDAKTDALEILLEQKSVWNEEGAMHRFASDANAIASGIQKNFKTLKVKTIRFTAKVPMTDKYGNTAAERVLALNFRTADLYKINFDGGNFTPQQLLDLSESVWYVHPAAARTMVSSYCAGSAGQYAATFCNRESRR